MKFVDRFLNEDSYGSADIRHILVLADVADGETTPTQEAMDAAKAEAQRILDEFAAGLSRRPRPLASWQNSTPRTPVPRITAVSTPA